MRRIVYVEDDDPDTFIVLACECGEVIGRYAPTIDLDELVGDAYSDHMHVDDTPDSAGA